MSNAMTATQPTEMVAHPLVKSRRIGLVQIAVVVPILVNVMVPISCQVALVSHLVLQGPMEMLLPACVIPATQVALIAPGEP